MPEMVDLRFIVHVLFANVVNSADVRMIECRGSMCFTLKARERLGITCKLGREKFKCDEAVQARAFCLIHDTHPAPAEFLKDAIVGDGLADDRVEIRHCYRHLRVQTVGKSTNPCGLCFGDKLSTRSWNY